MRRTLFVASWKANATLEQAKTFVNEFPAVAGTFMHEVILCPSFLHIDMVGKTLPGTVKLGAQDVSQHGMGPFTGETAAAQLAQFGVKYCIVGHVERRVDGETDEMINKKIKQLFAAGITPILIVGENLAEYDNNQTRVVIERQMKDALQGVKDIDKMIFSYQPAWSIGTGYYTSADYTNIIVDFMRKTLQKITGSPLAANVPILYGGGVTLSNAREYLECPEVDGIMFGINATVAKTLGDMVNTKFRQ
ncbi:MAG: triose-phosphate isomerase [Firmicutes bacterium]|nr:triose-phosphate isomerase [Bacillota bacterium]